MNSTPTDGLTPGARIYRSEESSREHEAARGAVAPLGNGTTPAGRQLPPGGNKISRITQHTKGLVQDVTSWVELKMKLAQVEVMEQVDAKLAEIKKEAAAGALMAIGGLFGLIALALGIAALLIAIGLSYPLSYFLGFTIVAVLFLGIGFATHRKRTDPRDRKVRVDESKLALPAPKDTSSS